ncbi:hypothetical protein SAMN06264365_13660 [Actinoplanes regularis]|uniref:Uncharacterized protein n=1 Tax=Actinoplanes regularis TaxID=52697 RepID=A0A239JMQ0_9ACTN|nr:hypothetical protein Are01nite_85770 [Actinoplanes regularis]SNT07306.1 hypothetical protein SAMN06264365_13660 [Actinoplanes regularis]
MNLIADVFAEVGRRLADLGVRPGQGDSLTVPGERGDAIFIDPLPLPSGVPGQADFMVNITHHLVPWTAFVRDESPNEALTQKPDRWQAVFYDRLDSPFSSYLPEHWEVTLDTRIQVADGLTKGLREALAETWLPLLPRAELRALIRDPQRKGPSFLSNPQFIDLMCRIEDMDRADLRDLVRYFHTREADDPDLGRLARWIERYFLTA